MEAEAFLLPSLQRLNPARSGGFFDPAFKKLATQLRGEEAFPGKKPLIFPVSGVLRFSRFDSNS